MFLKCQNFYTLGVEEYFTKTGYFTWRVSDCEELLGGLLTDKNFAHGRCLPYGQQNKLNLLHKMLPTYDESLNE